MLHLHCKVAKHSEATQSYTIYMWDISFVTGLFYLHTQRTEWWSVVCQPVWYEYIVCGGQSRPPTSYRGTSRAEQWCHCWNCDCSCAGDTCASGSLCYRLLSLVNYHHCHISKGHLYKSVYLITRLLQWLSSSKL